MKTALSLPALLLALLFAIACNKPSTEAANQDDPDRIDEYEDINLDKGTLPQSGEISALHILDAAEQAGGITQIPLEAATRIIDHYMERLEGLPGAETMRDDLAILREEINSGFIDRGQVGAALNRLGVQTRLLANGDAGYMHLGTALKSAGDQLVGDKMVD